MDLAELYEMRKAAALEIQSINETLRKQKEEQNKMLI